MSIICFFCVCFILYFIFFYLHYYVSIFLLFVPLLICCASILASRAPNISYGLQDLSLYLFFLPHHCLIVIFFLYLLINYFKINFILWIYSYYLALIHVVHCLSLLLSTILSNHDMILYLFLYCLYEWKSLLSILNRRGSILTSFIHSLQKENRVCSLIVVITMVVCCFYFISIFLWWIMQFK